MKLQMGYRHVDGVPMDRNIAAAVLFEATRDAEGLAWLLSRDVDMRWWCDVAGVNPDHVAERLEALAVRAG